MQKKIVKINYQPEYQIMRDKSKLSKGMYNVIVFKCWKHTTLVFMHTDVTKVWRAAWEW